MATKEGQSAEMLEHLKSLNLNKEEIQRFTTVLKDPEFKKMFAEYVDEISDPQNKEAFERHINICENNSKHGNKGFSLEGKELLLPYSDFCLKTYDLKTTQKVFINICYCEKIGNCTPFDDPIRHGTEWKIPYSLGGPSIEKDNKGKDCIVYDYIVGTETHKKANSDKKFKRFLISTAIEAIEKMKDIELKKEFSLPLIKYKGKNGSKEPRIFTINKEVSSESKQESLNNNNSTQECEKKIKEKIALKPSIQNHPCPCNVNKGTKSTYNEGWEAEIEPPFDVLYSDTIDFNNYWNDLQLSSSNTMPKNIIVRIKMANNISMHDILLDVQEKLVILRVPGKYRLKVDLKYSVNKLQGHAKWENHTQQLVVTLPVELAK